MRRVRSIRKNNHEKKSAMIPIVFVIIIVLLGIYLFLRNDEKRGTSFFDTGVNQDDDIAAMKIQETSSKTLDSSVVEEKNEKIEITDTRSFSVYAIQVASLTDKENIEQMIKQIDARELPYLVYKKNNSYKIYTKGFTKREQVEEYLGEIRTYFPDAFVFTKNLPSFEIKSTKTDVNIVDGEIINHITDLLVLMDTQSAALYNYYKKEGNSELHVELLTKQQMILDNLSDTIVSTSLQNTIFDKNELESMIQHQENNIKHSENLLSNIENANMYKVHSLFLDSLFRVFDVVN